MQSLKSRIHHREHRRREIAYGWISPKVIAGLDPAIQ
jgi:hypothetical protein